jgi:hypothetical protein
VVELGDHVASVMIRRIRGGGVVLLVIGLVRGRRTADPIPPSSWPQR